MVDSQYICLPMYKKRNSIEEIVDKEYKHLTVIKLYIFILLHFCLVQKTITLLFGRLLLLKNNQFTLMLGKCWEINMFPITPIVYHPFQTIGNVYCEISNFNPSHNSWKVWKQHIRWPSGISQHMKNSLSFKKRISFWKVEAREITR